uniref:HAT C-terminal dimerisation domain-containing protein n=1 Tax=Latimeria chalumnae TaxID=7897 RepID=H3AXW4_LATCH
MGKRNSIYEKMKEKNPSMYTLGCPCHIAHNAAKKGYSEMRKIIGLDIEDLMVDLFYWFKRSQIRKKELQEFCEFCDTEYKKVLKHVPVHWLSLELAIIRTLKLYEGLKSYFASSEDSSAQFKRLRVAFADPLTELHLLFLQAMLPLFTEFNLTLQKDEPCIYFLHDHLCKFLSKLLRRFVTPGMVSGTKPYEYNTAHEFQLENKELYIGFSTKQALIKLQKDTYLPNHSLSDHKTQIFYNGARAFLNASAMYLQQKLPFNDRVLQNSQFVDISRGQATFGQVEYFCARFSETLQLSASAMDCLFDQCQDFQSYVKDKYLYQSVDVVTFWSNLMDVTDCNGHKRFDKLCKVAFLVLVLPHSNSGEEQVFSIIKENKTMRSAMQNNMLSSLLSCKINSLDDTKWFQYVPSKEIKKRAKSVTKVYNNLHASKKN